MDNIKKFEDFLDRMQGLLDKAKKQGHIIVRVEDLENAFPELQESEDERIRKLIIATIHLYYGEPLEDEAKEMIAWLEKQGEKKSFDYENANIQQKDFVPHYKRLGRDKFLEILKENPGVKDSELKKILKSQKK